MYDSTTPDGAPVVRSPATVALGDPDRLAIVMAGSGASLSYRSLDDQSRGIADLLYQRGLRAGSHMAIAMENTLDYLVLAWAAQRSGLYFTPVNVHLAPRELEYMVVDSTSEAVIASPTVAQRLDPSGHLEGVAKFTVGASSLPGWEPLSRPLGDGVPGGLRPEVEGRPMFYSSGTTGRPKGVWHPLDAVPFGQGLTREMAMYTGSLGFDEDMVYLSPGPLYHTAPLMACMATHRLGGTAVVMERFEPEQCLAAIDAHRVTHGQWVPTMFRRMLRLPEENRRRFTGSSLRLALHAAAPCPVDVKRQMIDWWGPKLLEFYTGTEGGGMTAITSAEWLEHPGSVGRPVPGCEVHITDADGRSLDPGHVGLIWFSGFAPADFFNDPEKTAASRDARGWATLGDVGLLDDEGYLYLSDRANDMIVSGGVNIYPQEIEDVLLLHPIVEDAAVFGIPDEEFGEQVKAVVQLAPAALSEDDPADVLKYHCRTHLAGYKLPRTFEFRESLPRTPAGKLHRRLLRDEYWHGRDSRIV